MTKIAGDALRGGRIAQIWLWIWLISDATVAASAMFTVATYGGMPFIAADDSWRDPAETASDITASINVLIYCVTAILVLRWIYRSAAIAHAVSERIVVTPDWAVGRFFIPVFNLWKPYKGVAEIWCATANPAAPDSVATPNILRWWWGLWLTTSLFGHIQGRLTLSAETPIDLVNAARADLLLFMLNIPLVVVLLQIITQMAAMQSALLTQRAAAIDEGDVP